MLGKDINIKGRRPLPVTKTGGYFVLLCCIMLLASCSDTDYMNVIPKESSAVISIDMQRAGKSSGTALLQKLLHVNNLGNSGLDFKSKAFVFAAPDGSLGYCMKLRDKGDWEEFLTKVTARGGARRLTDRRGCQFAAVGNWVSGWNDGALLVMGPVTPAAQSELQVQMARYLTADANEGFTASKMYERLDSIDTPMAMVAKVSALPQKFSPAFMLGAPKDADVSQVLLSAGIENNEGLLLFHCSTFSFNSRIDGALKKAEKVFRPIQGKYVAQLNEGNLFSMFMNVDGTEFLSLLQADKGLQALLAGINAAIDMDNIIRSVNGDMTIIVPSYSDKELQISMLAQLAHTRWTADIGYWKQSVPKGSTLSDCGTHMWCYQNGTSKFFFGYTPDLQFYSGTDMASARINKGKNNPMMRRLITGCHRAMIIDFSSSTSQKALSAVAAFTEPVFGKVKKVVFLF